MVSTAPRSDWLYGRVTERCDETISYAGSPLPMELGSRLTMSVFYALAFAAVMLMPRRTEGAGLPSDGPNDEATALKSGLPTAPKRERWYMLDVVRIACVIGVISEHSGGTAYSEHNHGFATEWVLQWLFIVSGIAFMMSKATFSAYFVRYGTVFAVGVVFNIIGDAIARPEWYRDLGNTIFQMFYVVFITAVSFAAWPLRSVMRLEDDPFGGSTSIFGMQDRLLCLILYGTLFAASYLTYLVGWDLRALVSGLERGNSWSSFIVDVGEVFFYIISHLLICPTLVALHIYLRRTPHSAKLLSWIFLALTYLPIVLFPTQMAYGPQCIMLYILGLYVSRHPFAGTETIARTLRAYSAIFYIILLLVSMPTLLGRCDRYPPATVWERSRWYFVEMALAIILLTRTIEAEDPYDMLTCLGWWALWAFCGHVMLARVMPTPYGALTTYLTVIPFIVIWKCVLPAVGMGKKKEDKQPSINSDVPLVTPDAALEEGRPSEQRPYGTFGLGLFGKKR